MRKNFFRTGLWFFSFFIFFLCTSCNPGTGCLVNESAHVKMGKDGKLPTSGGYSRLFPKDFGKKKGRKK